MKCTECGEVGHPWWDHGPVESFGEEPLEPYNDWNITEEPEGVDITSRSQRRKLMDKGGMDYRKKGHKLGQVMYFDMKKG